jgi:trans-2,3-dihydro-3-hydroxyanthranilate isomerase
VIPAGQPRFVFGLNVGPIPVDLEWSSGQLAFAWMTQGNPEFGPVIEDRAGAAAVLGLEAADLHETLPVQEISCGVPFMFIPLRDRETVDRAAVNESALRRFSGTTPIGHALFLFSVNPPGADETVYSRMLAPTFGVREDPATGSASGPLGCYLVRHGIVSGTDAQSIVSAQGVAMKRPSRVHISIDGTASAITRVRVGGVAVLVGKGELLV